jgi:hypothetical protein
MFMLKTYRFYEKKVMYSSALYLLLTGVSLQAKTTIIKYQDFKGEQTLEEYHSKWINPYGLGEMAVGGVLDVSKGKLSLEAVPFKTSYDYSVYDHIKYLGLATQNFDLPVGSSSLTLSADVWSQPSGLIPNYLIQGTYTATGAPYAAHVLDGQQAGATIHLIDFSTGQLFDWFVYGDKAFCLTERLPSNITGSPAYVGRDKMYTQIVGEFSVPADVLNTYSIRYNRKLGQRDSVDFMINGEIKASVTNIGIPLDKQGIAISTYPSLGNGELLDDQIHSFSIAHGLFSLIYAFPFQHPESPELSVSIPVQNRIFGQGIKAKFDNFVVKIHEGN